MSNMALFLLLLTIFMLTMVAIIVHDKIVDKKTGAKGKSLDGLKSDKERALEVLAQLPPDATFEQILSRLRSSWRAENEHSSGF